MIQQNDAWFPFLSKLLNMIRPYVGGDHVSHIIIFDGSFI